MSDIADRVTTGRNALPIVEITASDGARATAYLHGAHVVSWIPTNGTERLFLSERSAFAHGAAIRGGVPVIFPQFANVGPLPKHGFARNEDWELVAVSPEQSDVAEARFRLSSSPATQAIWPRSFAAELLVSCAAQWMELELTVLNTDREAATFTAALHTYLRVDDVRATRVRGLTGRMYREAKQPPRVDASADVGITGEVDRVYLDVGNPVEVVERSRRTRVTMTGFTDIVVWNPGASLPDMEPDDYLRMLCVEAAVVGGPVTLDPGNTWVGTQRLESV